MDVKSIWISSFTEAENTLHQYSRDPGQLALCMKFSDLLINAYMRKATVFSCGNGGSHCDAMHFAEELTGRYRKDRKPLGALALGDPSHVTCTANDYGFEHIFSRQLEALGREGDVLLAISTSGNSKNVINAVQSAKKMGIKTVGLLGRDGGTLKNLVDIPLVVQAQTTDRIQEMHIKLIHIVIESVERALFPQNY